ncbi:MAG TPA: type IV secretion system protein VirD4, partial [Citricoccus sp.]|nr:type IV secretion system protein VirD4 [Citricoccus sp.]
MSWNAQNRQSTTGANNHALPLAILGLIGVYGAYVLVGVLTNRAVCGALAWPETIVDPLGFVATGDGTAFGTAAGCAAPTGTLIGAYIGLAVVLVLLVGAGAYAWMRYQQSDTAFIRSIRWREGMARAPEIRRAVGAGAARKKATKVRPSVKHPKPADGALLLGSAEGSPVWSCLEESVVLIGPPRSGKGLHLLIGAILDAPGPVITTSSRADNLAATATLRATKGPVALFDPQGLTGQPTTLKWSPITGCEVPRVANQRA